MPEWPGPTCPLLPRFGEDVLPPGPDSLRPLGPLAEALAPGPDEYEEVWPPLPMVLAELPGSVLAELLPPVLPSLLLWAWLEAPPPLLLLLLLLLLTLCA